MVSAKLVPTTVLGIELKSNFQNKWEELIEQLCLRGRHVIWQA